MDKSERLLRGLKLAMGAIGTVHDVLDLGKILPSDVICEQAKEILEGCLFQLLAHYILAENVVNFSQDDMLEIYREVAMQTSDEQYSQELIAALDAGIAPSLKEDGSIDDIWNDAIDDLPL